MWLFLFRWSQWYGGSPLSGTHTGGGAGWVLVHQHSGTNQIFKGGRSSTSNGGMAAGRAADAGGGEVTVAEEGTLRSWVITGVQGGAVVPIIQELTKITNLV